MGGIALVIGSFVVQAVNGPFWLVVTMLVAGVLAAFIADS